MDTLLGDIRFAIRMLRRFPMLTAATVTVLGLGVGSATTIFSLVSTLFLRPLPYPNADRIVFVWETDPARGSVRGVVSPADFLDWKAASTSLEQVVAIGSARLQIETGNDPVEVEGRKVTYGFFEALGVMPLRGRSFVPGDYRPGAQRTVVISHSLSTRLFGGDSNVVGRSFKTIDQAQVLIVGVMPPGFSFPGGTDIWLPYGDDTLNPTQRMSYFLTVLGKLRRDATLARAQEEMTTIARRLQAAYPASNAGRLARVVPVFEDLAGPARPLVRLLFGAVACLLLIACLNAAALLHSHGLRRRREAAIRLSLGASKIRIIRQELTFSLLLAGLGSIAGVLLAAACVSSVAWLGPLKLPRLEEVSIDWRVLLFATALTGLVGVVVGLLPAMRATRVDLAGELKGMRNVSSVRPRFVTPHAVFVTVEIGLSVVLVTGAALLIQSFLLLRSVKVGFNPAGVLIATASNSMRRNLPEALERLRSIRGVQAAGAVTALPLSGNYFSSDVEVEGMARAGSEEEQTLYCQVVTPGYQQAIGVPLLAGRFIEDRDGTESMRAVVINETARRRLFRGLNPIGRRLRKGGGDWFTVVGVVGDMRHVALDKAVEPEGFFSWRQERWWSSVNFALRTNGDPRKLAGLVRSELRQANRRGIVSIVQPIEDVVARAVAPQRLQMWILSVFGGIALALSAVGLYGVLAYMVGCRVHEFGVRFALGASSADVVRMVIVRGFYILGAGLVLGVPAAFAASTLLKTFLFQIPATDPSTVAGVGLTLAIVTVVASSVPAWRAGHIGPMSALREQ